MDRRNFFKFGIKDLLRESWKSPLFQSFNQYLQSLANILAPQGLDSYIEGNNVKILSETKEIANNLYLRPPGSLNEENKFQEYCTACGDCASACPYQTIFHDAEGGPYVAPNLQACHLCEDFPCIQACETGALEPLEEDSIPMFGKAHLKSENCKNSLGVQDKEKSCELCVNHCPVSKAVKISTETFLPEFGENCTGCGICREICPTIPVAIEIRRIKVSH